MKVLTFKLIPRSQIADIEDKTTTITKKTVPNTQKEKEIIGGKEYKNVKENIEEIKENVITKKDRKFGLGDFSINILMTEYDNFAESVKEIGKTIEKNKDNILDRFNKI